MGVGQPRRRDDEPAGESRLTEVSLNDGADALGRVEGVVRVLPRRRAAEDTRSGFRSAAIFVGDLVALTVAALASLALVRGLVDLAILHRLLRPLPADPLGGAVGALVAVAMTAFVLYAFGLYRRPGLYAGATMASEASRGFAALSVAPWLLLLSSVLLRGDDVPLGFFIGFWLLSCLTVPVARVLVRRLVWPRSGYAEPTLILGAGEVGHTLAEKIARHPEYNLEVLGFVDSDVPPSGNGRVPIIGTMKDFEKLVERHGVRRVLIAFSQTSHEDFLEIVRICTDRGVRVNIVPRLFEVLSTEAVVDDVEGIPLLDVAQADLGRFDRAVKRAFDIVVGGTLLLLVLPVMAVVALLVKLDSRGPVFFRQERMGRGGRVFRIYKFRSMHVGAERLRRELEELNEYSGPMFKIRNDPRVTRVGDFLRRWSIDELPQLINVVTGDMSLVGPRPLWVEEAVQCEGWTRKRLDITPGITGLWQVLGRSSIPFEEMVKLDYMYVTAWSLSWDIRLLMQTVPAILAKRGAY